MFLKTSGIWSKQSTTTLMQWISFGDYTEAVSRVREAGIPVMVMVQSVEEAVKAASLGASAVVAQVDYSHYHQPMSLQASADPYLQSPCGAFWCLLMPPAPCVGLLYRLHVRCWCCMGAGVVWKRQAQTI